MRDALNATGRPIFYSICNWGEEDTWMWGNVTGNSFRTRNDIKMPWEAMKLNFFVNQEHPESQHIGAWNDPDMLEVGNGPMTRVEEHTHFALWALAKAPLILGNDLTDMTRETLDILTNEHLIKLNQDSAGKQGVCV